MCSCRTGHQHDACVEFCMLAITGTLHPFCLCHLAIASGLSAEQPTWHLSMLPYLGRAHPGCHLVSGYLDTWYLGTDTYQTKTPKGLPVAF